jgi:multidrug efflux pump subunit AcrA (membrane-fusion protein)
MANWMNIKAPSLGRRFRLAGLAAVVVASMAASVRVADAQAADTTRRLELGVRTGEERGMTKPLQEHKVVFPAQGVVKHLGEPDEKGVVAKPIDEGVLVKQNEVLGILDDRAEQAQLRVAESAVNAAQQQIKASEADLELKQVKLEIKKRLYGDAQTATGSKNMEVREAEVEVKIGEIAVEFRKLELAQEQQKLEQAKTAVEQKKLRSPIDGVIAKMDVRVGEGADLSKPAFLIINNTDLYVEVNLPVAKARALKLGDKVQVRYADDDAYQVAEVAFKTEYADASSNTRRVKLRMPNPSGREAGLQVFVKLPDAAGGATPASARASR